MIWKLGGSFFRLKRGQRTLYQSDRLDGGYAKVDTFAEVDAEGMCLEVFVIDDFSNDKMVEKGLELRDAWSWRLVWCGSDEFTFVAAFVKLRRLLLMRCSNESHTLMMKTDVRFR